MSVEVQVPQLGESVTEAVITRWMKSDGDAVAADEPLCEIESDKATLDLPSPAAGTLKIAKQAGETVKVGETIARIEEGATKAASSTPKPAARPRPVSKPEPSSPPAREAAMPAAAEPPLQAAPVASPAAKRLAEESGVDVAAVRGSGRGGRVTKPDVVAAAARPQAPAPKLAAVERAAAPASAGEPVPQAPHAGADTDEERVKMTPIRRTIARRLVEAQHTAAILTTFNEVDMSAVMALRAKYKEAFAERHGVSLGFMSFFSRACVLALQEIREVNARIEGDDIVYNNRVHLGIAASTERGLVVPVVRNADRLTMAGLEREIGRLADLARTNKLSIDDLSGGTFTISNGGVFGSLLSTPILNPPQSGILGMHKIEKRPVVVGDEVVVRPMMYVALSYDHRIVDGRGAVTFLVRVKERLESPERMLLDL